MDLISNKYLSNLATRRCFYMRDVKKILEMRSQNFSQRKIAEALKVSRDTVRKVSKAADENNICWSMIQNQNEMEVQKLLFGKETKLNLIIKQPDYQYIHKELLRPGTNIRLLWEEYAEDCRNSNFPFYQYSYFCEKYRDYVKKNNLTMHITHKPGDKLMVDWNGTTMCVFDRYTGESIKAYLFEATLPFSMLCYVQACPTMKIADWIDCHINAYRYFEGVTRLLVPDNLKTGVISNKKYEDPVLNKSYQEMADHYDTTIIPTRVRKPRDKAAVEGAVGDCTIAIVGKLRNRKFFSFNDLNAAILKELDVFNNKPFQKREGSRKSVYLDEEKDYMLPLPETPFELSSWKRAKVQLNYHISVDKMNYSVPHEYVGNYVDVKLTKSTVTVYYKTNQICSHQRLYGRVNQYSTNESHMPENHKKFQWNKERFVNWALSIGPETTRVVEKLFERCKVEEQAYKGCLSLLKLSDKYGKARLEDACKLALKHIHQPSYKNIKMILQSNQDMKDRSTTNNKHVSDTHAFVRGKDYYGGRNNE